MDNWVIVLMWLSGWFYINGLRSRIDELEAKMLKMEQESKKIL